VPDIDRERVCRDQRRSSWEFLRVGCEGFLGKAQRVRPIPLTDAMTPLARLLPFSVKENGHD
jgi:hypothetical protein